MDKLRIKYLKLARCRNIARYIAIVSLIVSSVAYVLHLMVDNKISIAVFILTSLFFAVQLLIYIVIDIIMVSTAIKIDKELKTKRD